MARRSYLDELSRIRQQVRNLFDQMLVRSGYGGPGGVPGTWSPLVDVSDGGDAYEITAELPGVRREDIELEVRDGRLELSGRRRPLDGQVTFHRMERSYGAFHRAFELDEEIDVEGIEASLRRGVLCVKVPKRRPRSNVPISGEAD